MIEPVYAAEHSALVFAAEPISAESAFSVGCRVFVCGALQDPRRMSALLGLTPPFAPAVATGYRRIVERVDGEHIPFMVPDEQDPRSVLTGVVWLGLSQASLEKIESLELGGGMRRRIAVAVRIGELELTATTYVKR